MQGEIGRVQGRVGRHLLDRPYQPIGGGLLPQGTPASWWPAKSVSTASRIFRLSLRSWGVQTSCSMGLCRTEKSNVHRFTLISATQISAREGSRGCGIGKNEAGTVPPCNSRRVATAASAQGRIGMYHENTIAAVALAAALWIANVGAQAFEDATYPNLQGQWL